MGFLVFMQNPLIPMGFIVFMQNPLIPMGFLVFMQNPLIPMGFLIFMQNPLIPMGFLIRCETISEFRPDRTTFHFPPYRLERNGNGSHGHSSWRIALNFSPEVGHILFNTISEFRPDRTTFHFAPNRVEQNGNGSHQVSCLYCATQSAIVAPIKQLEFFFTS